MAKKNNKKKQSMYRKNLEKCLLCNTPGYDGDKHNLQFGRNRDDDRLDHTRRESSKSDTCHGSRAYCDIYFNE